MSAEVDAGTPAPTGVLTKAPVLLKQVEARFPPEMADAGAAGTVVLEIDIDDRGAVMNARVVQSAGAAFDAAALEAVKQFVFSPAEVDGKPAAVRIQYRYEFLYRPEPAPPPPPEPKEQPVNFAGTLLERGTRRPLAGAMVVVLVSPPAGAEPTWSDATTSGAAPDGGAVGAPEPGSPTEPTPLETLSDANGHFELRGVPPGTHTVIVTAPAHARYEVTETFEEGRRTEVTYYVRPNTWGRYETVVRAERERKEVSQVNLRQEEIRLMPGSQGDALRVVQNLPGVARAPFSAGLLVVRGGKPWDTRVYVDNTYVPQLFHFGGLYATFNSNLLEDIRFDPGNFTAELGRDIGGVVQARTKTPAQDGVHGYADLNLIDVSAMVEAPLGGDWSIAVGGRRSHVEAVLPLALQIFAPEAKDALNFTVAPRYYDYQVKLERRAKGSRDRLSLTFFGSNDRVAFVLNNPAYDPEGRADFETLLAYNRLALNWEYGAGSHVRALTHLSVGLDQFDFGAGSDLYANTEVYPVVGRQHFEFADLLHGTLTLSTGLDVFIIPYHSDAEVPPRFKLNQIPDPFVTRTLIRDDRTSSVNEPAVYLEAVYRPIERVKLVPGIRFDYDLTMNDAWVDPRFAAFVQVAKRTSLKGGIGLFHQPPDYRQGLLSPAFGNPDLLPEGAVHYSIGAEHQFTDAIGLDVTLYYKTLFHQAVATLAPPPGDTSVDAIDLRYTSTGEGRSYGAEILLRHQLTQNFFGWIAWSISRTERLSPLGTGKMELSPLDQPHNLVALGSYKLPGDWVIGARIRYTSGPLDTPYVGAIYDANGNYYFPIPGERYSRRLPAFFQLDVRVDKRFVFDTWSLALYADVQNVTNRGNVEGVYYNFDYTRQAYVTGLPILPAIGARGEW
ncbi:MAG: TonB-dependent receptor [Myxococcaceae bacterium]|nr:TonB-dependent receptor [Myxococcaceae bacterium]